MNVKVTRVGGHRLRAECGGFEVSTGRVDKDHAAAGMSPPELLVAAVGLCVGSRIVTQMENRGLPLGALEVTVKSRVDKDLRRVTSLGIEITAEADLTPEQYDVILEEAQQCMVANTIKNPPEFSYSLKLAPRKP